MIARIGGAGSPPKMVALCAAIADVGESNGAACSITVGCDSGWEYHVENFFGWFTRLATKPDIYDRLPVAQRHHGSTSGGGLDVASQQCGRYQKYH